MVPDEHEFWCVNCQKSQESGKFCQDCGMLLRETGKAPSGGTQIYCPECHRLNSMSDNFCVDCGYAFSTSAREKRLEHDQTQKVLVQKRKSRLYQVGILLAVVVTIAVAILKIAPVFGLDNKDITLMAKDLWTYLLDKTAAIAPSRQL